MKIQFNTDKNINGEWGRAVNLGASVNSKYDEDAPFLHPDGVTLFFSSDGQPTLGGSDIFKSELKDGKWTKPENLGYPINSSEQEGFFTLSADILKNQLNKHYKH